MFTDLTLAVFRTRLFLPRTTATIATPVLTRTCIINYFAISQRNWSEIGMLLKSFQPKLTGSKNIEANVYEVVSSQ